MAKHKKSKKKNAPDTPEVPVAAPDTARRATPEAEEQGVRA